jgi:phenylpropionate dioxygenase-like ring-hydroxylating dioxygenase large terminal subunit
MPRITLPPYPNGWFAVAHVDELAVGEVKGIHYFGRELVLFRGEDTLPRALDGYCAHLGAHLATGGKVVGNTLRCPFHSWRFDGESGGCVEIPYAKKIPPKAQLRAWPTIECNGMILVHHHMKGEKPTWMPEVVGEIGDPNYVLQRKKEWVITSHPQEIMENGVDFAHFETLHGWKCKRLDWRPDGPYYRLKIDVDTEADEQAATADNITDADSFNSGPGFLYTRFRGAFDGIAVNALTPIEPERLHIIHRYYAHKRCAPELVNAFLDFYVRDYELDIPIWSNKVYRPRPNLADGENDFGRFRRWYAQFYSEEGAQS